MPRPPEPILLIARTHVVMGGVILFFTVMLYALLRDSTVLELSRQTYAITITLSVLYLLAGLSVWQGWPIGRPLNYVCALLYLARPPLGLRIWKIMRSPEYREHFQRKTRAPRNGSAGADPRV